MEERQRHFVLVHGAGHGAWCWYKVATLLKSSGHKVTALDLAACGVHPKQVDDISSYSDYHEPLMEFMMSLPPEERVILVGHSMGGISVSAALERFPEKISAGVFATAFMLGPNLSYITAMEELDRRFNSYMDTQYLFKNGPTNPPTAALFGPNFFATNLYQLCPAEDLTLATLSARPMPIFDRELAQKVLTVTREKYGSVPRIFIVCDQDSIVREDMQRWIIEKNPTGEVMVIGGSDHMVMLSKPKELCSSLQEIAKKYI